jgi:hypothetical protein
MSDELTEAIIGAGICCFAKHVLLSFVMAGR